MAVRVGFEPTRRFHVCRFSRPDDSTTLAPHREGATYCQIWNIQYREHPKDHPHLAEVKIGGAAKVGNGSTRRQLLEYSRLGSTDTTVLVDATTGTVRNIRFSE